MAQYQIIELNEQASTTKNGNGDYSVVVGPATTLEEGDIVSLEKAFLDTAATGDEKITIPEGGVTLDFTVGYYLQSVRLLASMDTTNMDDYALTPGQGDISNSYVDGRTYVLMQEGTAGADLRSLSNFILNWTDDTIGPFPGDPGTSGTNAMEFIWQIQFTDGNGRVQHGTVSTWDLEWYQDPDVPEDGQTYYSDTVAKNIQYDPAQPLRIIGCNIGRSNISGGFNNQKTQFWTDNQREQFTYQFNYKNSGHTRKYDGGFYIPPANQTGTAEDNITPFTQNTEELGLSINIPQGQFTPTDLAQIINDGMARNYADPTVNNEILKSAFFLKYSADTDPFQDTQFVCIDRDADNAPLASFKINPDPSFNGGILVGASQMELDYDQDRGQFLWAYLHTPYLTGATSAPRVESVEITEQKQLAATPAGPGNNKMLISRNSGIFFQSVRSRDQYGNEINFWENLIGWGNRTDGVKMPSFTTRNAKPFTGNIRALAVTNLYLPESLEIGQHTTTGFNSISSVQDIVTDNWWAMPNLTSPYSAQTSTSVPIFSGHEDITNNTTEIGYYLVEVSGVGAGNQLKSGGQYLNRQIMGIVSGYFAKDSFTTGTGSDSLSYVHRGLPISLEGFSVRILGPDKTVADNIGVNNSIMLRITKSTQPAPLREEQS